jgi:hypothetical protein
MYRAEHSTWHFSQGVEELTNALLYVRDVTGLEPTHMPNIPPHLAGRLPNWHDKLDTATRAQASAEWPRWWRAVLDYEIRVHLSRSADQRARLAELRNIADPPAFGSLADCPALRKAAQTAFADACRWVAGERDKLFSDDGQSLFGWHLIREVAEEVAIRRGVQPGQLRGCVVVLFVEGGWSVKLGSGAMACSVMTAQDPVAARDTVRTAFESALSP